MYFTEIPDRLKYNSRYQAQLSVLHANMIDKISRIYIGTSSQRTKILQALNYISYKLYVDGSIPGDWSIENPLENIYYIDDSKLKSVLGSAFISPSSIKWNLEPVLRSGPSVDEPVVDSEKRVETENKQSDKPVLFKVGSTIPSSSLSDISLSGPTIPQIDINKIWARAKIDGTTYCIYYSLPQIPSKQNEISLTTDASIMSDMDLIKLYPSTVLQPRDISMYTPIDGLDFNSDLGVLFEISGFSKEDIIKNVIEYPQIFSICRLGKSAGVEKFVAFGKYIEIDGKLELTSSIWNDLSDTKYLPKTAAFMQEYVVRRYILERDVKKIKHKYDLFGTLNKHLSLILPVNEYQKYGYSNLVEVARQCVESRISYIQSRNPVIRRMQSNG